MEATEIKVQEAGVAQGEPVGIKDIGEAEAFTIVAEAGSEVGVGINKFEVGINEVEVKGGVEVVQN